MIGVRLEMFGLLFTGPKTIIHNLKSTVEKAGLIVDELIIAPLALTETILNDGEKDFGTIVVDMGGGQTSTAVMHDHQLKFTDVNPEGGEFVTSDVSQVLNTSHNNAEALKINYGDAYSERASESEEFPVDVIGKAEPERIDEKYLAEIIEARETQIFQKSRDVLADVDALDLPGGIVLTGGGASLPGVVELATEVYGTNVKLFVPNQMGLRNPVFTNVISLVEYASNLSEIYHISKTALTGERVQRPAQQPVQQPVQYVDDTTYPEDNYYPEDDYNDADYPEDKPAKKKGKFMDKLRGTMNNIFD
jgi:cell division protein FtsA